MAQYASLAKVLDQINTLYINRNSDEREKADWHLARAMMTGYARIYPEENFEVVALEQEFSGPIINPETGAESRTFILAGKVDGIVKLEDSYYLLEHKTASQIDSGYLERLWTDLQICLYSWYVEKYLGYKISEVIYNILTKAKLKQSQGETEAEFEERRDALIAKSKTGKSSAKRKMPEPDEDFQARLAEKYTDPQMFHREVLYISRDQFVELQSELWELSQAMLGARRRNAFYRNTSYCFQYNRPCAYYPLCSSNGNPNVIENLYERKPPHLMSSFLKKRLAYRIQELFYGGLSEESQKKLAEMARKDPMTNITESGVQKISNPAWQVLSGTRLIREWSGKEYEVIAKDKGFEYNGKHYRSLSAIATEITGTKWNGVVFFGLRKR